MAIQHRHTNERERQKKKAAPLSIPLKKAKHEMWTKSNTRVAVIWPASGRESAWKLGRFMSKIREQETYTTHNSLEIGSLWEPHRYTEKNIPHHTRPGVLLPVSFRSLNRSRVVQCIRCKLKIMGMRSATFWCSWTGARGGLGWGRSCGEFLK